MASKTDPDSEAVVLPLNYARDKAERSGSWAARGWCVSGCNVWNDFEIKNEPRVMSVEPQAHVCSKT